MSVHTLAVEVKELSLMEMSLPRAYPRYGHIGARTDITILSTTLCFLTQAYLGCNATSRASAVSGLTL